MTQSLVTSLLLALVTALVAASAVAIAGWGWLAALGVYSIVGSTSLVTAAIAMQSRSAVVAPARNLARGDKDRRAFA